TPEDIVKAMVAGGNAVMLGSMFSGTEETPGDSFEDNGCLYKSYRGMGSIAAMENGSKDRYFQGEVNEANKMVPEGIEARVAYKGALVDVLNGILTGMRQEMASVGESAVAGLVANDHLAKSTQAVDFEAILTQKAPTLF
ncbi:IMP dehydrogenase, partial [Leuconostoc falkenbergense]|uniref:IMP dehydrogenase n=2 Tax=Lactobacillaceae TaxID=33958 RepID=UPI003F9E54A5